MGDGLIVRVGELMLESSSTPPSSGPPSGSRRRRSWRSLAVLVLLLAGAWTVTLLVPAAPFILDDDAHALGVVALREGGFQAPGVSSLGPSRALFWFDPAGHRRSDDRSAFSAHPPFYAVMAQPFALLGWQGLQLMQGLCFGLALWLVYGLVRRRLGDRRMAALAVVATGGASYLLEYATGLWPHMLSLLLCTLAFVLATESLGQAKRVGLRAAAGLAIGLACGVRYQNAVYAAALGLGVFVSAASRWTESASFVVGLAPPLLSSALVNKHRLGTFNPISKGGSYLSLGTSSQKLRDAFWAFMARLLDSSQTPDYALVHEPWWMRIADSGAVLHQGVMRKAWLQSLPWVTLPLLLMARALKVQAGRALQTRNDLRLIALVVAAQLAVIVVFGIHRHEGLAFNQRYLIDLIPLLVHALVLGLDELEKDNLWRGLGLGAAIGVVAAGALFMLLSPTSVGRQLLVLRLPLVLAAFVAGAWLLRARYPRALAFLVGLALAWSAALHASTDLRGSLRTRHHRHAEARALAGALPKGEPIALFAYWGNKDCVGPLLFTHDIVAVDAHLDEGASAPRLVRQLLDRGRRVFVIVNGHGRALFRRMGAGLKVYGREFHFRHRRPWLLVELRRH